MSNKTVPNLMSKLFASKFWPSFFPLHGRLWTGPGQQESGEVQEPHASICFSLGSNTSHKTNVLPQKLSFSQPINSKDLLKKILHSREDDSETWSPATFSPLLCLSTMCPQYGTKFECLAKEAGQGRVGKTRPRSWQKTKEWRPKSASLGCKWLPWVSASVWHRWKEVALSLRHQKCQILTVIFNTYTYISIDIYI